MDSIKTFLTTSTAALALTFGAGSMLALTGCDTETGTEDAIEDAGDNVQDAGEDAGDALRNTGDNVGNAVENTGDRVDH